MRRGFLTPTATSREERLAASLAAQKTSSPSSYSKELVHDATAADDSTEDDEPLLLEENAAEESSDDDPLQLEANGDDDASSDGDLMLEENADDEDLASIDGDDDALLLEENDAGAPIVLPNAPELTRLLSAAEKAPPRRMRALRIFFEGADAALQATLSDAHAQAATRQGAIDTMRKFGAVLAAWPSDLPTTLRHSDQGFFASFLSVLDALLMAPEGAELKVDWTCTGREKEFTYGARGQDVWAALFAPIHLNRGAAAAAGKAGQPPLELRESRFNPLLRGEHKFEFRTSRFRELHRAAYRSVFTQHVHVQHPDVLSAMTSFEAELAACGGAAIGVHKRIDTPGTRMNQGLKAVYSLDDFVEATRKLIDDHDAACREAGAAAAATLTVKLVYLATDDKAAVSAFRAAFGDMLRVREGVTRVSGGVNPDGTHNEVHARSQYNPTCGLREAADVLTDALLLARCRYVLHMDSNVSTAVALMAPATTVLRHVADVLARPPPQPSAADAADVDKLRAQRARNQERKSQESLRESRAANGLSVPNGEQMMAELKSAPHGWNMALGRLWSVIMCKDRPGALASRALMPNDPLTPLTARLLLGMTEKATGEVDKVTGEKLPQMSKAHLVSLLNDKERLVATCERLMQMAEEDIAEHLELKRVTKQAAKVLLDVAKKGTTMALFQVRKTQALGKLPLRIWAPPTVRPDQPLILPGDTSAETLWKYVHAHVPVIVRGAFQGVVDLFSPPQLSAHTRGTSVPCRHTYRDDAQGRRVFSAHKSDMSENADKPLDFGEWVASAGDGEARAKEVYPAKMPLPRYLPRVASALEELDNPLTRFGACVGQLAEEGVYMYAGAGANTTHTHLDPAENLMFVAAGTKRLQLFAPGDVERLYPWPAPLYHSCAVPPFHDTKKPPVEFPAYGDAKPVEVELRAGDMMYLPAFWYHCVQGGDGFNVVLAWWTEVHAHKRDDAVTGAFEPVRPAVFEGPPFMPGAVDELKFAEEAPLDMLEAKKAKPIKGKATGAR